jgi:hypothetical protein
MAKGRDLPGAPSGTQHRLLSRRQRTPIVDEVLAQRIKVLIEGLRQGLEPRFPHKLACGQWRSLVAHQSGGLGVVGSNPACPTMKKTRL